MFDHLISLLVSNLIFASLEFLERSSMPILQFFLQNAQATSGGVVSLVENWGKKETKQHIERREAEESMNKNRISGSVESHQTWVPFYCFFGGSAPGRGGCRTLCGSPRGGAAL